MSDEETRPLLRDAEESTYSPLNARSVDQSSDNDQSEERGEALDLAFKVTAVVVSFTATGVAQGAIGVSMLRKRSAWLITYRL
jgi:hypothetical protein